jgi:hypothetical protein
MLFSWSLLFIGGEESQPFLPFGLPVDYDVDSKAIYH